MSTKVLVALFALLSGAGCAGEIAERGTADGSEGTSGKEAGENLVGVVTNPKEPPVTDLSSDEAYSLVGRLAEVRVLEDGRDGSVRLYSLEGGSVWLGIQVASNSNDAAKVVDIFELGTAESVGALQRLADGTIEITGWRAEGPFVWTVRHTPSTPSVILKDEDGAREIRSDASTSAHTLATVERAELVRTKHVVARLVECGATVGATYNGSRILLTLPTHRIFDIGLDVRPGVDVGVLDDDSLLLRGWESVALGTPGDPRSVVTSFGYDVRLQIDADGQGRVGAVTRR